MRQETTARQGCLTLLAISSDVLACSYVWLGSVENYKIMVKHRTILQCLVH